MESVTLKPLCLPTAVVDHLGRYLGWVEAWPWPWARLRWVDSLQDAALWAPWDAESVASRYPNVTTIRVHLVTGKAPL